MARTPPPALLALLLPAALFAALHLRALDYPFVWTDTGEIEYGTLIRPLNGLLDAFWQPMHAGLDYRTPQVQSYYRPLQVVAASLVVQVAGREPRAFRALNLALGVATALLFTAFAFRLFGSAGPAAVAGAIFAAHPGNLEVYVWIAGLSAALADLFVLASVFAAVLAMGAPGRVRRAALAAASLASLALALASKEHAVVTPALVAACAVAGGAVRVPGVRAGGRQADRTAAVAALALVAAQGAIVLAYLVWRPHVLGASFARAPLVGGSLATQVWSSLALWPGLLGWLLVPVQSTTSDVIRVVATPLDPGVVLAAVVLFGSLAAARACLRSGHGAAFLSIAWIWIAFLPVSGVVPLLHARAERNLCLCLFGAALLWPAAAALAGSRAPRARRAAAVLAIAWVAFLAARTWARAPDWSNEIRLFQRDVARDPDYREGRYQLAIALVREGRPLEAKQQLDVLLAGRGAFEGRSSYLRASNLFELACHVNREAGRDADTAALVEAELAGRLERVRALPGFAACGAGALEAVGRPGEALELYTHLLRETPPAAHAAFRLGAARCHARLGNPEEARAELARVERTRPLAPELEAEIRRVRALIRRAARGAQPGAGAAPAYPGGP